MLEITLKVYSLAELHALGPALAAHLERQSPPTTPIDGAAPSELVSNAAPAEVVSIEDAPAKKKSRGKKAAEAPVPDSKDPAQSSLVEEPAPAPAAPPVMEEAAFIAEITSIIGKKGALMGKVVPLLKEFGAEKARFVKPEDRDAFLVKLRKLAEETA